VFYSILQIAPNAKDRLETRPLGPDFRFNEACLAACSSWKIIRLQGILIHGHGRQRRLPPEIPIGTGLSERRSLLARHGSRTLFMLVLNESHLRQLLPMREVARTIEDGFRRFGLGLARAPARLNMPLPELNGVLLGMPAVLLADPNTSTGGQSASKAALGAKIVSVFPENTRRRMDVVQGFYALLDAGSGALMAIMDGKFLTGIRTAATSAVATRYMARRDSKTLAVFGAGIQAGFHIEAMIGTQGVGRVIISSRTDIAAHSLAASIAEAYGIPAEVATSPRQALADADIVCTCTTASGPLFDGALVRPGTHINAVGAFTPHTRELDTQLVARSRVVIDAAEAAGVEAGEILVPLFEGAIDRAHVQSTLADVVLGKAAGRTSPTEVTLFKSCGLAVEDLVTASLAYERAVKDGVGINVAL